MTRDSFITIESGTVVPHRLFWTTLLLVTVVWSATAQQQAPGTEDIFSTLKQGNLTELQQWLTAAGLDDTLRKGGTLTLLAPSNNAFASLPPAIVWKMKADDKFLASVLKYHVIEGRHTAAQLVQQKELSTLQGENVEVVEGKGPLKPATVKQLSRDATFLLSDIVATNGLVHLIDKVIFPPSEQMEASLEEVLGKTEDVSTFLRLVEEAGLLDVLREGGPLTVFAPTDAAFRSVDPSIIRQLRREPRLLRAVILSHLVSKDLSSFELRTNTVHENNLGELIIFREIRKRVLVNTALVVKEDLIARNGAAYIIDGLLLPSINALGRQGPPPTTNLFVKMEMTGLSIFADLIRKSGINIVVQSGGPMTIFGPSDKAFSSLTREEVQKLNNDTSYQRLVLLRHIIPDELPTSDFKPDLLRDNLGGEKTRLNVYRKTAQGDVFTAGGVPLSSVDVRATNGVLHVLDEVLPSAAENVLNVLRADIRFDTFLSAIQASDLITPLRSDGPVTVFAATNEAFLALPQGELFDAFLDLTKLSSMVVNHVVSVNGSTQTLFSPGLCWTTFTSAGGNTMRTAMGSDGKMLISSGNGRVARITETNLLASNGVVHVVDNIL